MPERLALCMSVSELEVVQDWNSLGLRGSGSNTVIATNLFVPEDMVINFNDWTIHRKPQNLEIGEDYLYYNKPFFPAFYMGFAAMAIGGAERVIVEFIDRTKKRVRMDGTHEGQSAKAQRVAAELSLQLKQAKGLLKDILRCLNRSRSV